MKEYIFEKGCGLPLCYMKHNQCFDYITGQAIINKDVLKFIEKGIKARAMELKKIEFVVIQILTKAKELNKKQLIGYIYCIDGLYNYLDINRQPLNNSKRQYVINKLMAGEYIQEVIWE